MSWVSDRWGRGGPFGSAGRAVGRGANFVFGKGPQAIVPPDMAPLRGDMLKLLQSLLSPGAFNEGGAGNAFFFGGVNGAKQLLNGPSPEMRTYDTARPILEGMLTGTGPQFERDIATANSQGGRFGSANAIMRGEALRNLFNQRGQTAQTLGMLAGQAGSAEFDRTMAVQSQILQLLVGLLGMGGQATLGLPVENDKGIFGDLLKAGLAYAGMRGAGGGGGGGGGGGSNS